jgi:hypothetical protein
MPIRTAARGRVNVDHRHGLAVEGEIGGQGTAAASEGRAGHQFGAAFDIGHALGVVEEAVADVAARLAAGAAGHGGGDFDIDIGRPARRDDGVDHLLGRRRA